MCQVIIYELAKAKEKWPQLRQHLWRRSCSFSIKLSLPLDHLVHHHDFHVIPHLYIPRPNDTSCNIHSGDIKSTRCKISWRLGCHTRPGSWKWPNGDSKIKSSLNHLLKSVHGHFQVVVVLLMLIYRLQGSARNCDASLCQCACACASVSTSRTSSSWALGQNIRTSLCSA